MNENFKELHRAKQNLEEDITKLQEKDESLNLKFDNLNLDIGVKSIKEENESFNESGLKMQISKLENENFKLIETVSKTELLNMNMTRFRATNCLITTPKSIFNGIA